MCYNTPVMEFGSFEIGKNDVSPENQVDYFEEFEKDAISEQRKAEKTAKIRKLAISQAIDPAERRRKPTPELSMLQHPEAYNPEPIRSLETETVAPGSKQEKTPSIEQLTTPELLQVAGTIVIEGITVRRLYETNQIDHRGLAAIVKAALKGGNIERTFKKHELGLEAKQGRKIEMRHDDPSTIPHTTTPDHPSHRVQSVISRLQKINSQTPKTPSKISSEPDLATISQQKAQAAIKKKYIFSVATGITAGIAIGVTLAILLLV